MYEYFGQSWKVGLKENFDSEGIDRSVWFENDKLDVKIDHNSLKVWLYLLEDINNKDVFKIGITASPYKRCSQVNDACRGKHKFKIKEQKFIGCREKAFTVEQAILNVFSKFRLYKRSVFNGSTEIILIDKEIILKCFNTMKNV